MVVHVLTITHAEAGVSCSVHSDQLSRHAELYQYVQQNWNEWMDGDEMPLDQEEAIEMYFEFAEDYYDFFDKEIKGPEPAPADPDIEMSEDECEAVCAIMSLTLADIEKNKANFHEMGPGDLEEVSSLIQLLESAYNKLKD